MTIDRDARMKAYQRALQEVAPQWAEFGAKVVTGDLWERPGLSKRDRSLITVATSIALYRSGQLADHIRRALDNGVTKEEIGETITHLAFYAGWPTAANAVVLAKQAFDEYQNT